MFAFVSGMRADIDSLISWADNLLYHAKRLGRDRVAAYLDITATDPQANAQLDTYR